MCQAHTVALTMTEAASPRSSARDVLRAWMPTVGLLLMLVAARDTLANHYTVPSGSMQPALRAGDRIVVDMRGYGLRIPFTDIRLTEGAPQRGDVVVFDAPDDGTRLVKRVVAVGGDRVALQGGRLLLDGQPLAAGDAEVERFGARAVPLDLSDGGGPDIAEGVVPEGHVLVLGDHRGDSRDGRYFGLVRADAVYGRAVAVYWRSGEGFTWRRP